MRGIIEEGDELADFFLIFGEPMIDGGYFLNKLSKAARASLALRGARVVLFSAGLLDGPAGSSRATVNMGVKKSHVFAWSLRGIRSGIGFRH